MAQAITFRAFGAESPPSADVLNGFLKLALLVTTATSFAQHIKRASPALANAHQHLNVIV